MNNTMALNINDAQRQVEEARLQLHLAQRQLSLLRKEKSTRDSRNDPPNRPTYRSPTFKYDAVPAPPAEDDYSETGNCFYVLQDARMNARDRVAIAA